jgi:uncharacterized PurR-regulated membrane protein YhhQ (DUF165 family)
MLILGLFSMAVVMAVIGVAITVYGNPLGLSLVLLGFVPACVGSFTAGVVMGKDSDGP